MDSQEVFYDEYENGFVIKKNDYVYARIPDRRDLEHFLTVLVKSTTVMPEVEINDDVLIKTGPFCFLGLYLQKRME